LFNSEITSIPLLLGGPNFLAKSKAFFNPKPVPVGLIYIYSLESNYPNNLNNFEWFSFLIPKPVSMTEILICFELF